MQSSIHSLSTPVTVTFQPSKVYDPETGKYTAPVNSLIILEVFLLRDSGSRTGTERPGLEEERAERFMQIVGTEGDAPLKLPATIKAGDTGTFTELGKSRRLGSATSFRLRFLMWLTI